MPQRSLKHIIIMLIVALLIFIGGIAINQIAYAIAIDLLFVFFMLVLIDILSTLEEIRDKQLLSKKESEFNSYDYEKDNNENLTKIINSYQKDN